MTPLKLTQIQYTNYASHTQQCTMNTIIPHQNCNQISNKCLRKSTRTKITLNLCMNHDNLNKKEVCKVNLTNQCEDAMRTRPTKVITKATVKRIKFFLPLISLNKKIPYMEPTKPGPDVINGKEMENPNFPFATNQAIHAIPHMAPTWQQVEY